MWATRTHLNSTKYEPSSIVWLNQQLAQCTLEILWSNACEVGCALKMANNMLVVNGVPDDFSLFSYGSGRYASFWKYRLKSISDWSQTADITISAHTKELELQEVDNHIHFLGEQPLSVDMVSGAAAKIHEVLSGRVRLFSNEKNFAVSPLESIPEKNSAQFTARFSEHFIFGTAEVRHIFRFSADQEPALVHIQIKTRKGCGISADDSRFDSIRLSLSDAGGFIDRGIRQEPTPQLMRMHQEGIPTNELNPATVALLEKDLEDTLPELHVIGHMVTRLNILMRQSMGGEESVDVSKSMLWSHEICRMALDLPDSHFRQMLASACEAKISVLLRERQTEAIHASLETFDLYIRLLQRLPDPMPVELGLIFYWFVSIFQYVWDISTISAVSKVIVETAPDEVAIGDYVFDAIKKSHASAPDNNNDRMNEVTLALEGIHRCELGMNLLHKDAELGKKGSSAMMSALFSDIIPFSCGYQAKVVWHRLRRY